jgi:hypothetical protein
MPLTLQQILTEADTLVPNLYDVPTKIGWLNELNTEFFEIVKIPKSFSFSSVNGNASYPTNSDIRGKNIVKVQVGTVYFPSFLYDLISPGTNYHLFDESTYILTLSSAAKQSGLVGLIKYFQIAETSFVSSALTISPDAPPEYHWIYIGGLCSKIAKAMEDIVKANNYSREYQANLSVAQQNYAKSAS